jgi:hypothetical protein
MAKSRMNFFKDADGLFQIDGKVYPKSKMTLEIINAADFRLDWIRTERDNNPDSAFFQGSAVNVFDVNGNPYNTVAAFKTANKEFFV